MRGDVARTDPGAAGPDREQGSTTARRKRSAPADPAGTTDAVERMAYGLAEVASSLGLSTRTINRMMAAGTFPQPDRYAGRKPLWKPSTIRAWMDQRGDR